MDELKYKYQDFKIDKIQVSCKVFGDEAELTYDEVKAYIDRYKVKNPDKFLKRIDLVVPSGKNAGNVELLYILDNTPFERIRRITGYLVGDMDRWNNAKAAEEQDRVKHKVVQLSQHLNQSVCERSEAAAKASHIKNNKPHEEEIR